MVPRLVAVVIILGAREEGVFALVRTGVPVGPRRLGFGASAGGRLRWRVGVRGAVVVGLLPAVRHVLLPVRVRRVGVLDVRVRPGGPAAVVVLLLVLSLVLRLLLGLLLKLRLLLGVLLSRVLLLVVLLAVLLVVLLLAVLLLVVLLRLTVCGLLAVAPASNVVLRLLRLLRIVLRLAAVGGLLARVGLLSAPSAVPVQRVLRMPRFGAFAPAILSHRSPRAARRWSPSSRLGYRSASLCAVAVRTPPHRAERYRIAIR
jgi:hypothetical protein